MLLVAQWLASLASNQRVSALYGFRLPQVAMLWTSPSMILSVELDIKP